MIELTVIAYGNAALSDITGLDSSVEGSHFRSAAFDNGTTTVYRLTNAAWDRVRPSLRKLAATRMAALDSNGVPTGKTCPVLEYSISPLPGRVPRMTQLEQTTPLSLVTDGVLTVRGINLLAGMQAMLEISSQSLEATTAVTGAGPRFAKAVKIMRVTANAIGPVGTLIGLRVVAPSGAGSVATELRVDGDVRITVTPAAAAPTVSDVVTQINSDPSASYWVTAAALVGSARMPLIGTDISVPQPHQVRSVLYSYLGDGDGGGLAVLDVPVVAGVDTNRLRLTARKAGNPSNHISLVLKMSQIGNSVSVSGKKITVNRTGATDTLGALVTAINGNAAAAALVFAAAVGAGSLGALTESFLYGGAGEEFVATVGGAPASITHHDDTSLVLAVLAADLVTAGVADMESVIVQVIGGTLHLQGQVQQGSVTAVLQARVRAQANVTLAAPGASIDGVAMVAGQMFWSDVQTTSTQDGLYIWNGAATPATRAPELPAGAIAAGRLVSVHEGTNAGVLYQVTNTEAASVVGTNNLTVGALGTATIARRQYYGVLLANLNYVAQYAAGAAIDDAVGPFTRYHSPRTVMVVAGAGAVAHDITIDGINPRTGAADSEVIAISAAGTFQGAKAWRTITRVRSSIDPGGTINIRAGAGVYLGSAVTSIDAVGVSEVYEAPAAASSAAEGVVVFATVPNGTRTFVVDFT